MVRLSTALAVILFAAVDLFADVILWRVDDDYYSGEFTAARVMVTPTGNREDAQVLSVLAYNEDTHGYTDVYPDGIGLINDEYKPGTTLDMWSLISPDIDRTSARFYIELGNYTEGVSGDLIWTKTVAVGDMASYDWLESNHSIGTGGMFDNAFNPWDGKVYKPVPEPTSGVLVLIGFALLSLKRRRTE